MRVVVRDFARSDDEDVDIAPRVAVAASGRAEDREVDGRDLPTGDFVTQAALELGLDALGEELDGRRREVLTVERVGTRCRLLRHARALPSLSGA